ncbi:MAG TPA: UDP-N-acetylmuramoyl-L-alanyl-D-glutamate--2,6-diaminopimelate ligase [Arenimonas sp.]|uniref:UDP-N-acetylmuramoyl-L-alanyl-D-glutamate--2, 6-diaminopimelate ligase n=1 Tax=Arenimonas sp. TaxID=1872635 RepID=UPI002C9B6DB8|nr:UDP-N-acetylmuramoyl-L-alanyl-D-glutamate--2,6-diaminopimelate ligase [Arenimonas sp.]HMB56332.1 UDP-N-acetylmuramoyl-L-alanyl-D-glutamate--2,6-diaminopimelate ligase [Arenimonas sp.]
MMRAMPLHELLAGEVPAMPIFNPVIHGLSADSRELSEGDAFIALAGATTHGLNFVDKARAAKVAAIVFELPAPADVVLPEHAIGVADLRHKLGRLADRFYGAPSKALTMTGVTGTNGKTSTVQLIAQALSTHGETVGTIGTLGAGLYGEVVAHERTTPDVIPVHRLLAEMREQGATQVAMEVSSHGLELGRVDEVAFRVAVFTNLTRDHLDFHGSMESYGAAKAKLFAWPTLRAAVINVDDAFGIELLGKLATDVRGIGVSSRGNAAASLRAERPMLSPEGLRFTLSESGQGFDIASPLLGRFNIDNLLAVAGALRALNWNLEKVAQVLPTLSPVGGRMSRVGGSNGQPLLVVDYAHTPDALEQALASLREHTPGRLTCVFGCGGDRDRGKRPQMALLAERGADRVIVTDDNPRSENGDAIVADILEGFNNRSRVEVERDRAAAIALALAGAGGDDIILIAGKGHETYQDVGGVKHPFDDLAVARGLLEARA